MLRGFWFPLVCLALAGCGGGGEAVVECAPFARALTGVALSGAAADWWHQAKGRYVRTQRPEVGSVLVFRRSGRLPSGHVAVVLGVVSRREIRVTQANWVHHRLTEDQPVVDVSPDGDWSSVRVWWPPAGQMGVATFSTFGFIRPEHPAAREQLRAATPGAVRIAAGGR